VKNRFKKFACLTSFCLLLASCGDDTEKSTTKVEPQKATPTVEVVSEAAKPEKKAPVVAAAVKKVELMAGDAARGLKVFKRCASCHSVKPGGKHKVGPNLFGVIGRVSGQAEGYKYSKALASYNQPWTADLVEEYIINPSVFLKAKTGNQSAKSKMSFKLKKAQARKDVVAYLMSVK